MADNVDAATVRWMAAMWAEATYLQNVQLEEAIDQYQAALADEQFRAVYEGATDPTLRASWESHYLEATRKLTPQLVWSVGLAKYFFLLAVAQLDKCVDLLPEAALQAFPDRELLRKLRNFEEHWEDPTGPSAKWLRARIPDVTPGRLTFNKGQTWIEGMEVAEIVGWAQHVDSSVRRKAELAGEPMPASDWDSSFTLDRLFSTSDESGQAPDAERAP